jgi:hypothetical protein
MASGDLSGNLDFEAITKLAQVSGAGKSLSVVHFLLEEIGPGTNPKLAVCFVVHVRTGGFMLAIPNLPEVQESFLRTDTGAEVLPAFFTGDVEVLGSRGKKLGEAPIMLVDLPGEFAQFLLRPINPRSAQFKNAELFQVQVGDEVGRPSKDSVFALADQWFGGEMEPDTVQEYVTGDEHADAADSAVDPATASFRRAPAGASKKELLQRIAELEGQVEQLTPNVPKLPATPQPPGRAQSLFAQQGSPLTATDWSKIQKLAGAPPPRAGAVEQRRNPVSTAVAAQDQALAVLEKEAEEDGLPADPLESLVASGADPVQQMLAMQMQQTQLLLARLAPKHQDPVLGALAGSGSGSASGGSNVKGCLAREAFQRAIQDLPKVAAIARLNALRELGFGADREDASLMRKYVERRIPLAEHRQLALFATMLAESWAIGFEMQDQILMGTVARMLFFVEQTALDSGRTQLSWLLTGYTEPAMHMMLTAKKRRGLQPFSRLCPPSWISANLSYLRDLDFFESRLASLGKPSKNRSALTDDEKEDKPTRKAAAKPKGRGKGRGGKEPPADASTPAA